MLVDDLPEHVVMAEADHCLPFLQPGVHRDEPALDSVEAMIAAVLAGAATGVRVAGGAAADPDPP